MPKAESCKSLCDARNRARPPTRVYTKEKEKRTALRVPETRLLLLTAL
jgi:hypothetical protein